MKCNMTRNQQQRDPNHGPAKSVAEVELLIRRMQEVRLAEERLADAVEAICGQEDQSNIGYEPAEEQTALSMCNLSGSV